MSTRCTFCNNAVLEFQQFQAPSGKIYHQACYNQSQESLAERQGDIQQLKKQQSKEFEDAPKIIGTIEIKEGSGGGFIIDPVTRQKKAPGNIPKIGGPN